MPYEYELLIRPVILGRINDRLTRLCQIPMKTRLFPDISRLMPGCSCPTTGDTLLTVHGTLGHLDRYQVPARIFHSVLFHLPNCCWVRSLLLACRCIGNMRFCEDFERRREQAKPQVLGHSQTTPTYLLLRTLDLIHPFINSTMSQNTSELGLY